MARRASSALAAPKFMEMKRRCLWAPTHVGGGGGRSWQFSPFSLFATQSRPPPLVCLSAKGGDVLPGMESCVWKGDGEDEDGKEEEEEGLLLHFVPLFLLLRMHSASLFPTVGDRSKGERERPTPKRKTPSSLLRLVQVGGRRRHRHCASPSFPPSRKWLRWWMEERGKRSFEEKDEEEEEKLAPLPPSLDVCRGAH